MTQPEPGLCPCGCIGKRRRGSYVDRTIDGASGVLRRALFTDDVAAEDGLLQRLDPRAKLVSLVIALVAVSLLRSLVFLALAYGLTLVLARASSISVAFFVKRVWLFVPIFTGIVVLPATLNVITPGEIVIPLGHPFGHELGITRQGLTGAALIVTRVATSISLVVLVTITTPWPRLLAALRSLRVPRMFVLVIGMAYRYLFVLLGSVSDMFVARKARTVAPERAGSGRAFVMSSAGALFGKAHLLSEEVHQAMVARGYRGQPRLLAAGRLSTLDVGWIVACVALCTLVVTGDRALGG
jgi:cobalt ECF transporter T component CbiQ